MNYLFAYGSLRKGENEHHFLKDEKQAFEQAVVKGSLYDSLKGYPYFVDGFENVYGEVYEVTNNRLQVIETYIKGKGPHVKEKRTIKTDVGEIEAYVFRYEGELHHTIKIERGDWKEYVYFNEKPETTFYFAYGSCMDIERFQLADVDHHFQNVVGAGKLQNYSLRFTVHVEDGGRADIVEDGGMVEGILYELPFEAVLYLYQREGVYRHLYRPTFVDVKVDGKMFENCLTFVVCDKKEDLGPPDHYMNEILRGSKGRVSDSYYEQIKQYMRKLQRKRVK